MIFFYTFVFEFLLDTDGLPKRSPMVLPESLLVGGRPCTPSRPLIEARSSPALPTFFLVRPVFRLFSLDSLLQCLPLLSFLRWEFASFSLLFSKIRFRSGLSTLICGYNLQPPPTLTSFPSPSGVAFPFLLDSSPATFVLGLALFTLLFRCPPSRYLVPIPFPFTFLTWDHSPFSLPFSQTSLLRLCGQRALRPFPFRFTSWT